MGIKFHCPNGHKLNVKAFLAGKKGVCPKCGTSVRIPLESEPQFGGGSARDDAEQEDLVGDVPFNPPEPAATTAVAPQKQAQPATGAATAVALPVAVAVKPAPSTIPVAAPAIPVGAPAIPVGTPAAVPAPADPIAEAPTAHWYVRPPGGEQQYGPARGDLMRRWIAEGRVASDSLVWREGWSDWRNAGQVFPSLAAAAPQPPPPPAAAAAGEQPATPMRSQKLTTRYEARKRQGSGLAIAALVVLGLVCVILAILLVYFLGGFHNGQTTG